MTDIRYPSSIKIALRGVDTVMMVASYARFTKSKLPKLLGASHQRLMLRLANESSPGDLGASASTLCETKPGKLVVGLLPDEFSRYNSPARPESVRKVVQSGIPATGKVALVVVVDEPEHAAIVANAVARALPIYSNSSDDPKKTGKKKATSELEVRLLVVDTKGELISVSPHQQYVAQMTRESAELVDTPPSDLHPRAFAQRVIESFRGIKSVKTKEIVGDKLLSAGLGGIHAVGRASVSAPCMVTASYTPAKGKLSKDSQHIALVGKGVCFDTGGLHLKPRGGIEGMKCDMGGAAAVFGAFRSLVEGESPHRLTLIMCLAENAIGSKSYKPDDILTLHSGKTVEINNTDAEGRLLLADGVSYAARELGADVIIDAATLTGAQAIATGAMHAAVFSNDADLEARAVAAGKTSGDLAHPLIFAPEFYKQEFSSSIADMTNSVHTRMNAQSSCAAQFIYWHIEDEAKKWLHIDLAAPAFVRGRATGYGVALIHDIVAGL